MPRVSERGSTDDPAELNENGQDESNSMENGIRGQTAWLCDRRQQASTPTGKYTNWQQRPGPQRQGIALARSDCDVLYLAIIDISESVVVNDRCAKRCIVSPAKRR
jgi:hypothetical protein